MNVVRRGKAIVRDHPIDHDGDTEVELAEFIFFSCGHAKTVDRGKTDVELVAWHQPLCSKRAAK